jgi:hypothetical protein
LYNISGAKEMISQRPAISKAFPHVVKWWTMVPEMLPLQVPNHPDLE